jgi:hypothetical protein
MNRSFTAKLSLVFATRRRRGRREWGNCPNVGDSNDSCLRCLQKARAVCQPGRHPHSPPGRAPLRYVQAPGRSGALDSNVTTAFVTAG